MFEPTKKSRQFVKIVVYGGKSLRQCVSFLQRIESYFALQIVKSPSNHLLSVVRFYPDGSMAMAVVREIRTGFLL